MRRLAFAALISAACGLAACTPTYPKCDKDEHCKTDGHNEVCVNGMCQECGQDTDCKPGFACKANKCTPKPECTADQPCPAGFKCKEEKCVAECAGDTDCASGLRCKSGRCTPPGDCSSDADCTAGKKCDAVTQRCVDSLAGGDCQSQLGVIHFEFNDSSLTTEARRQLDKAVDCFKGRRGAVTLSGHCDERGTEEYNLHLGERRANSVKKYLSALGIDPKGLKTVSYGKERPADPGHDEAAWAKNRRVELSGF